jgi:pyruvate dehydrogenase E2 component (dihydrolipoamide acetyltransferase)
MATIEIHVPDIGDFDDVTVIELLVKPGDTVRAEQSLLTVESDKASMEIPSSHAGVVRELQVALGSKVKQGTLVLLLEAADTAVPVAMPPPVIEQNKALAQSAPALVATASVVPQTTAAIPVGTAPTGDLIELRVPDIGDFKDVTVIEVMINVGDTVRAEQSLITVESDKASMEIPSSCAGVVKEIKVKLGDKVNVGDLLGLLQGAAMAAAPVPAAAAAATAMLAVTAPVYEQKQPPALVNQAQPATEIVVDQATATAAATSPAASAPAHNPTALALGLPHASPSVRKFARELGVPLAEVKGSGLKGRITDADVQAFTRAVMGGAVQTSAIASGQTARIAEAVKASGATGASDGAGLGLIPWPKVDFAKFGPIERKEMSRIKKISGANLLRNAIMIPAVTNHDDADITELEAFRVSTNQENEKSGVKVTMLAFLIKACVAALKKFPDFNSSLDGDALIYKQYYHIGFAADTPNGLMVPVIKDADKKGIFQISQEMSDLAKKARDGKLSPAEMSGATFTISSLGGIGGRYFTPIINAPEVAILGVCRSTMEPVWDGKAFQPRLMLPLSLTWDHRVIDGAAAARFNVYLSQILGDFRRVLL